MIRFVFLKIDLYLIVERDMLFNSYIFILSFLPICLIGYFGLNHFDLRWGQIFLAAMSLWFYGYFHIGYLLLIIVSMAGNYLLYSIMGRTSSAKIRDISLVAGIVFDMGLLFYFKYFNFFMDNLNVLFRTDYTFKEILLPLGISFFTFQQISFIVDAYKGEVTDCDLLYYISFVTYFPQLIAGPIVSHDELIPQFMDKEKKSLDWRHLSEGIYLFALGLAKKVLLADTFGNASNWGFANIGSLDTTNALLSMLAYTIQLYFDFSGYCDMAIGLGKMMNIDLPLNFNSPYKALTITEFWKRWHITLTRFFTKYVYIPLGGNRKGRIRTYVNTMAVFLLSGLWHGAAWTFVLWGALHGIFMVVTRIWQGFFERLHPALNWLLTFSFVNVTWVLFRAETAHDALRFLNRIALLRFGEIDTNITGCFHLPEFQVLLDLTGIQTVYPHFLLGLAFAVVLWILLGTKNAYERMLDLRPTVVNGMTTVLLLVWCIFSLTGVSIFLYFNF